MVEKIEYEKFPDGLSYTEELEGGEALLKFKAEKIRLEKTGAHAEVQILINDVLLAADQFNLSRLDPRQRMANKAHKQLNTGKTELISAAALNHRFDEFCIGLWDANSASTLASWVNIDGELSLPEYIVNPFLLANGAGTILYGEPAKGKSWFTMMLAQSIQHNIEYVFDVRGKRNVIFVNLERDEDGVIRRMRAVNRALGLDYNQEPLMINRKGWTLERVKNSIEKSIEHHDAELVILDSISRAGLGLTNDEDANAIMDHLNSLGVSWLGIAHTPKSNTETVFGSQMFLASADVVCQLTTEEQYQNNKLGLALQITKANDIPKVKLPIWAMEFDDYGIHTMREAYDGEFLELTEFATSRKEKVIEFLRENGPSTVKDISASMSIHRSTASGLLSGNPEFVALERDGKEQIYGLTSLHQSSAPAPIDYDKGYERSVQQSSF